MFNHTPETLPFIQYGSGPLVVLLHGFTDSGQCLTSQIQHLAKKFLVVALDLPGHGIAEAPQDPSNFATSVKQVDNTLRRLVSDHGKAILIGHSMGGALALYLAATRPELVHGVVAEDPALLNADQIASRLKDDEATLQRVEQVRQDPVKALADNIRDYPNWMPADRAGWLSAKEQINLEVAAACQVTMPDWSTWITKVEAPTLIISADGQDVILGETGLKQINDLAKANISVALVNNASHSIRRDNQAGFDAVVDPVLDEWTYIKHPGVGEPGPQPSQSAANYYIDPELRPMLAEPYFPTWDIAGTRRRVANNVQPTPQVEGANLEVKTVDGITVRIWSPSAKPTNVIYMIHGGGFIAGTAAGDDVRSADLASRLGVMVISPEYRLSPEAPFPIPAQDCLIGARFAAKKAEELDAALYIGGDSAGGGLAEPVICWMLDEGYQVAGAIMIEPFLDPSLASVSMRTQARAHMWPEQKARNGWQAYLNGRDPYELPRLVNYASHEPKPRVLTAVAAVDSLRDEGIRWTTDLVDAGFNARLTMPAGTFHAGLSVDGTKVWQFVRAFIADFINE